MQTMIMTIIQAMNWWQSCASTLVLRILKCQNPMTLATPGETLQLQGFPKVQKMS